MYILISGGFENDDDATKERIGAFVRALGAAVSKHGHTLLNGCRTEFDLMIAEAAYKDMQERGVEDPDERVISYVLAGHEPLHDYGTIIKSQLADWDVKGESFYIPEQVQKADAVILVERLEYEQLNTFKRDWDEHAADSWRSPRRSPNRARCS